MRLARNDHHAESRHHGLEISVRQIAEAVERHIDVDCSQIIRHRIMRDHTNEMNARRKSGCSNALLELRPHRTITDDQAGKTSRPQLFETNQRLDEIIASLGRLEPPDESN